MGLHEGTCATDLRMVFYSLGLQACLEEQETQSSIGGTGPDREEEEEEEMPRGESKRKRD